jgi:RNA polymerase sigma factor (sigma-70 family)
MQQKKLTQQEREYSFVTIIKTNDEAALKKIYQQNYRQTEQFILNNNGSKDEAKDTYQEAFIAVWRNVQLDKFLPENEQEMAAYLYRVAKNKWIDHLRSAHYKKVIPITQRHQTCVEADRLEEHDERYISEVAKHFSQLGDNCREVLTRFYYARESMKKIADYFKWTEATARNNKYRCLQHLRQLLIK